MKHLTPAEWYLWRKFSDKKNPWDRYLNTDFLKSERKRIREVDEWNTKFRQVPYYSSSDEMVCYYVVPIKIRSGWLQYLEEGAYLCKGLSALRNCPVYPLIAFFPSGRIPMDYSLIRINSYKKIVLLDGYKKTTLGEKAIIVEDWEKLESDSIYVDVPFESRRISRIFEENIGVERTLAESLQSPIVSSPFVLNDLGGISLASILDWSDFAHELCKTMELMLPPEYRSFLPPKSGINGVYRGIGGGIDIRVAERIVMGSNYFSSVEGSNFSLLNKEKRNRIYFRGEYSILGTMLRSSNIGKQLYKDMLHRFFDFEISIPDLNRLTEYDVDTQEFRTAIDEDLWLQNVFLRANFNPSISIAPQEEKDFLKKIEEDIKTVLGERAPERFGEVFFEINAEKCFENTQREAKSLARADGKERVDLSLLKHARNNLLDRLWDLEKNDKFKDIKFREKMTENQIRYLIVENILRELRQATAVEIYQIISLNEIYKKYFDDIKDLILLLNWSEDKYLMYRDQNNRYGLV